MKRVIISLIFLLTLTAVSSSNAQTRIETVQDKQYLVHTTSTGETLYSLSKKYNISEAELKKNNTYALRNGLRAGTNLYIPYKSEYSSLVSSSQNTQSLPTPTSSSPTTTRSASASTQGGAVAKTNQNQVLQAPFERPKKTEIIIHKVARKETLSSISRQYGISVNDIIKYNPDINPNKKLKKRTKLTIPQYTYITEDKDFLYFTIRKQETPYSYARTYNLSTSQILEVNPHLSESHFPVGEVIRIPRHEQMSTLGKRQILTAHDVTEQETMFGISKKYNCTQDQLLAINKQLQDGVKAGTTIYVPSDYSDMNILTTVYDDTYFDTYTSPGDEDIISISAKVGRSYNDLVRFNKQLLDRQSEKNEIIYIPKATVFDAENSQTLFRSDCFYKVINMETLAEDCSTAHPNRDKTFNVAVFLPLNAGGEDKKADDSFLRFYDGFLLALNRMQDEGMKVHTTFIDDENTPLKVKKVLEASDAKDLDLIIGPIYPETQKPASDFSKKNEIPMVSPFVNNKALSQRNALFYSTTPSKAQYIPMLAKYISEGIKNINLISINGKDFMASENYKVFSELKSMLAPTSAANEYTETYIGSHLSSDQPNVILISSNNEAKINLCVTYLSRMSKKYDIRIISTHDYDKYSSLQREYLHSTKFTYINPYFLDSHSSRAEEMVDLSREVFSYEPNNYNLQGFDIGYYFMGAIYKYGKNFSGCLTQYSPRLTQGDYNFIQDGSGHANNRLQVIEYSQDFEKRVVATVDEEGVIMK
ncbi:MAG: LysM peptidoglycan-binding domain-containing protein [Bacteroidales bacterium]